MRTVCLAVSLVLLGGCVWAQDWEIEYLPELPGTTVSGASGGNDRGQVVGFCDNGVATPVLWDKGEVYPLPIPEGYQRAVATSIKDSGLIVGGAYYDEFGPLNDKSAVCIWNTQCELVATIHILQHTTTVAVTDEGVVFGYAYFGGSPSERLYFTWTRQKGIVEITDLVPRLSAYSIVGNSKMVGYLGPHAIVLEKAHDE